MKTEEVNALWDKYWQQKHPITPTGKLILRAKQKTLAELLRRVDIKTVIDIGCGQGHCLQVFQEMGYESKGIDLSPTAVQICRAKGLKNTHHQRLEDTSGTFDLVFSDGLIEHLDDFSPYVDKMTSLSSMYVLLAQTDHSSPLTKILRFLSERFGSGRMIPELRYMIPDFVSAFAQKGFILIREKPVFLKAFKLLLFQRSNTQNFLK